MMIPVRLQCGKSEQIVKILDTSDAGSLLFIGQKGTVVFRNENLEEEAKFNWDLCSDIQKKQGTCLKSRKASFTVTDASYLNVANHYCLCTTNRTLHFIHALPSAQWETFRMIDFPTVPTCLENNFQITNKRKTCELFIGDIKGNIYVLTFFYPRTMLFARNYNLETQIIHFKDLKSHESYVNCTIINAVHTNLINKIQCISHWNILISNSKLDKNHSLKCLELSSSKNTTYTHQTVVTCFDFCASLNVISTGSKDFQIRIWRKDDPVKPDMTLWGHKAVVADLRIHSQREILFSICKEGVVRTWNLITGSCLHSIMVFYPISLNKISFGNSTLHVSCHLTDTIFITCNDFTVQVKPDEVQENTCISELVIFTK